MSNPVREIDYGNRSWQFSVANGHIVIVESQGPFGLPTHQMAIPVEIARSFEKAIIATAKTICPERVSG
jgi:hypothetical protein